MKTLYRDDEWYKKKKEEEDVEVVVVVKVEGVVDGMARQKL